MELVMNNDKIIINKDCIPESLWLGEQFTKGQAWIDICFLTTEIDGKQVLSTSKIALAARWQWNRGKVNRFFKLLGEYGLLEEKIAGRHCVVIIKNQKGIAPAAPKKHQDTQKKPGQRPILEHATPTKHVKTSSAVNYNHYLEFYNTQIALHSSGLIKCNILSPQRRVVLKVRINEYGGQVVEDTIKMAATSPFLGGSNNMSWRADFSWIMKAENFIKIREGSYLKSTAILPGADYGEEI